MLSVLLKQVYLIQAKSSEFLTPFLALRRKVPVFRYRTCRQHLAVPEVDSGGSAQEEARRNAPCEEEAMVLPARGDAHSAFVALAAHTSSRENEVQPVVSGAMRCVRAFQAPLLALPVHQAGFPIPK